MFAFNREAKLGKTFREDQMIHLIEKYVGIDLTDFYTKYIHGTDSLPIDAYLAKMGYKAPTASATEQTQLAVGSDSLFSFLSLDPTGPLATSGIKQGDVLIAINGTQISLSNMAMLSSMDSINGATMTVRRDGKNINVPIVYSQKSNDNAGTSANIDPNATPLENAIRKGIVGQ